MRFLANIVVLFCCIVSANAQVKSGVLKGDLEIGEQTELIYEVNVFSNSLQVNAKPFRKIIPALRFSEDRTYENPDSIEIEIIKEFKQRTQTKAGETNWKGSYTITVWDTGYFVIPPFEAKSGDSSIQFSPILIHVTAPKEIKGKELYESELHNLVIRDYYDDLLFLYDFKTINNIGIVYDESKNTNFLEKVPQKYIK
jgi:hypothetical protein